MDYRKIIAIEPGKRSGQPCNRGMRLTVSDLLGYLASGMTEAEVIEDFPNSRAKTFACFAFAAACQGMDTTPQLKSGDERFKPRTTRDT